MTRVRPTLLALVLSGLAGCAVGPDYVRPAPALGDQFHGAAAVEARHDVPSGNLVRWWEGFDDPLLTRLIAKAIGQNLDLQQAQARVAQARAGVTSATSALLPSGNVEVGASKTRQSVDTPLGQLLNQTPNFDRNGHYYEGDAAASWELDVFGGARREREAAVAEYEAARAAAVATRLSIAAETADAYIRMRGLQARIAIAGQQVDTSTRLVSTVRLQFEKGVAAELQLRQAEGSLAQIGATVPALEIELDQTMNAIDVLVGEPAGTMRDELAKAGTIPRAPGIASMGAPSDLLRRRPDLIVAERRLAASSATIGAAISEYYPHFSLGATLGSATTFSSTFLNGSASQGTGTLGLRWRLFDFGRVNAEIAVAKGRNQEALLAYRQAALRATADVEDALSALVKRESQARQLASGVDSLQKARDASLAAYKGGVVSLIEVLDADHALLGSRTEEAVADEAAARAAVASFRALGGGWDADAGMNPAVASATGIAPAGD